MGRAVNRMTAKQVAALREPGRHADGGGLYLHVKPSGWRGWCYITRVRGKRREIGLGAFPAVSLADARAAAARIRLAVADGADPIAAKPAKVERPTLPTFAAAADEFVASMESAWRNEKHRAQWRSTLATYCKLIAKKPVDEIGTDDVLACLTPIWTVKAETASRLRGRIERILDYSAVKGWRERGLNPAAWKGNLALTLPPAGKLKRGHHGAMPYADVPAFMTTLSGRRGIAARALAFTILTAARSGEVRGATWVEIDMDRAVWTVPADRMKKGREHRVPLSPPALGILEALPKDDPSSLIFPGAKRGRPMSDMTLSAVLRRMKLDDLTVHGFRASFSTWVTECTDATIEVREAALAHVAGDRVAAAYNRSDHFARRRALMAEWANYVETVRPHQPATMAVARALP